MKPMDICN